MRKVVDLVWIFVQCAIAYVKDGHHGDFYAFPINEKAGKNSALYIAFYSRAQVLKAFRDNRWQHCFNAHNMMRFACAQRDRVQKAMGKPYAQVRTEYASYIDLPMDKTGSRWLSWELLVTEKANECAFLLQNWKHTGEDYNNTDITGDLGTMIECKGLDGILFERAVNDYYDELTGEFYIIE